MYKQILWCILGLLTASDMHSMNPNFTWPKIDLGSIRNYGTQFLSLMPGPIGVAASLAQRMQNGQGNGAAGQNNNANLNNRPDQSALSSLAALARGFLGRGQSSAAQASGASRVPASVQAAIDRAEKIADQIDPDKIIEDLEKRQDDEQVRREKEQDEALEKQNTVIWRKQLYEDPEADIYVVDTPQYGRVHLSAQQYRDMAHRHHEWPLKERIPAHFTVGLYQRDKIEGPVFIANMAADYLLYAQLKKVRVEHIFNVIKSDHVEFEKLLSKTVLALDAFEEQYKKQSAFKRLFSNYTAQVEQIAAPLNSYIQEKLTCFGLNPFKANTLFRKEIVAPILLRLGLEKLTDSILDKYITKFDIRTPMGSMRLPYSFEEGYVVSKIKHKFEPEKYLDGVTPVKPIQKIIGEYVNNDLLGARELDPKSPISVVNIAKFLFDHRSFSKLMFTEPEKTTPGFVWLNRFCGWNLERYRAYNWLLKPRTQQVGAAVGQILSLCMAARLSDSNYQMQWTQYLHKNRGELILLLQKYGKVKKEVGEDHEKKAKEVRAVEQEIKNFILKGHKNNSWLPWAPVSQWLFNRTVSEDRVKFWSAVPVALILGGKLASHAYTWYKNIGQAHSN